MKKYQVMIDEEVSSQTFTFDEMLELGLLDDFDENIRIKLIEESVWQVAREYPFHVSEAGTLVSNFVVNCDGSVTRKNCNTNNREYTIDEFGQIRRRNDTQVKASPNSNNTTGSVSSRNNNSSSNDNGYSGCIWAIIVAVGIIVLIAIL